MNDTVLTINPHPPVRATDTISFTTSSSGWGTATAWDVYGFGCRELRRTPQYPTRFKTYPCGGGIELRDRGFTQIHLQPGSTIQIKTAPTRSADGLLRTLAVFRPRDVVRVEIPERRELPISTPGRVLNPVYESADTKVLA